MIEELVHLTHEPTLVAYLSVIGLGALLSLGSCTTFELPILVGYIKSVKEDSLKGSIKLSLLFVLGLFFSYTAISFTAGYAAVELSRYIKFSGPVYIAVAVFSLILGFKLLGLINFNFFPFKNTTFLNNFRFFKTGSFTLGFLFALIESITCPTCILFITAVAGLVVFQKSVTLSLAFLLAYVIGKSIPVVFLGSSIGFFRSSSSTFSNVREYIHISLGILLIIISLYLFWLA